MSPPRENALPDKFMPLRNSFELRKRQSDRDEWKDKAKNLADNFLKAIKEKWQTLRKVIMLSKRIIESLKTWSCKWKGTSYPTARVLKPSASKDRSLWLASGAAATILRPGDGVEPGWPPRTTPVALFSNLASGLVRSWLEYWRIQQKKVHARSYKRQTNARSVNRLKLKTRCFAPHSYLLSLQSQPNTSTPSRSRNQPNSQRKMHTGVAWQETSVDRKMTLLPRQVASVDRIWTPSRLQYELRRTRRKTGSTWVRKTCSRVAEVDEISNREDEMSNSEDEMSNSEYEMLGKRCSEIPVLSISVETY